MGDVGALCKVFSGVIFFTCSNLLKLSMVKEVTLVLVDVQILSFTETSNTSTSFNTVGM